MFGKILTEDNEFLLRIVFDFGGYIRQSHTEFIYPEISYRARSAKLLKLCEMGYLKQKKLHTNSRREPNIYQVTTKACDLFGKKDSNLRKNHKEEYILRALLKSEFLCRHYHQISECVLTDNGEKVRLLQRFGCSESSIPTLMTPTQNIPFIDEVILETECGVDRFFRTESGNILGGISRGLVFVYPDKRTWDIKDQLVKFFDKYMAAHREILKQSAVTVLVLTDSEERKNGYIRAALEYDFFQDEVRKRRDILKLYLNYLAKRKEELFQGLLAEIRCSPSDDLERITAKVDGHFLKNVQGITDIDTEKHERLLTYLTENGLECIESLIRNSEAHQDLFPDFDFLFECVLSAAFGAGIHGFSGAKTLRIAVENM